MRFFGMTLAELLLTIAIMGILSALSIPTFRQLQARQALKVAQRGVQSSLYQIRELSLAPPSHGSTLYDIVGYGVYFSGPITTFPCPIEVRNEFVALFKIIRFRDSSSIIQAVPIEANPSDPNTIGCPTSPIRPEKKPENFFVLPNEVRFNSNASSPSLGAHPWLVTLPLDSVGDSLGSFPLPSDYIDPLSGGTGTAKVVLEHKSAKRGGDLVTRFVEFSRGSNSINVSTGINK